MSKKQIVISIIGASLLTVGAIGGIWSGIDAMPKIINNVQVEHEKQNKEEVIYNSEEKIVKLNIDSVASNVVIKKHDKPNVIVGKSGNKEISTVTIENINNELIIKEERQTVDKKMKNINDMVRYFINEMYSSYNSEIIVYLPEKVNADIKTQYNGIVIGDDIILDTLNYETSQGYINLNNKMNFENLNIKSDSNIALSVGEMSGIKNVNLIAFSVSIYEDNSIVDESNIPENVEIKTTSKNYDDNDVNVESNIPVAKNLVIDSNSKVIIDLPLIDYKFNFDVKASRNIDFDTLDNDKYSNTYLEKYFKNKDDEDSVKEFSGLINKDTSVNKNEYFVKIRSAYTEFN